MISRTSTSIFRDGRRSWRRRTILTLVVFLLGATARAQTPAPAPPTADALIAPLYHQLAQIKGMVMPGPPPPVVLRSRDEIRRYINDELDQRISPARVEQEKKALVAWGLIPADYDLLKQSREMLVEQLSAYYDPKKKVMVLGDWLKVEEQVGALLHELVHALQDREIPLATFIDDAPGKGDEMLARKALIEGEAVALMIDVLLRAQGRDFAALPDAERFRATVVADTNGPEFQQAPKFIQDLLLFQYADGLAFVHGWRKRNPWSTMTTLYRDPPRSTAQILHPEKRVTAREDPLSVALPDLGSLWPAAKAITDDEMGEFALGSLLGLHLGAAAGRQAAIGWRGDRYRIWEDDRGRFVIVYLVVFDSPRVANAFGRSYTSVLERRYPTLAGKGVPGMGAIITWQDGDQVFVLENRGAEFLVVENVPATVADRVRELIWGSRPAAATKP